MTHRFFARAPMPESRAIRELGRAEKAPFSAL